jgi:hypothetical protein
MGTTVKEIAAVLRSTETMADIFVQRVQERVDQPVPHAEILATMKKISTRSLTTGKVVAKIKQERKKRTERARTKKESQERAKERQERSKKAKKKT